MANEIGHSDRLVGGDDREVTAVGHRVPRVDRKVEDRAFELVDVAECEPCLRIEHRLQGRLLSQGPMEQVFHGDDEGVHVDGLGVKRLPPGKREQSMRERGGALSRIDDRLHDRFEFGEPAVGEPAPHHLQAADHAREHIVEIVRDAARQLADGFHLLSLAKLSLGLPKIVLAGLLLRDVAAIREDQVAFVRGVPCNPAE